MHCSTTFQKGLPHALPGGCNAAAGTIKARCKPQGVGAHSAGKDAPRGGKRGGVLRREQQVQRDALIRRLTQNGLR